MNLRDDNLSEKSFQFRSDAPSRFGTYQKDGYSEADLFQAFSVTSVGNMSLKSINAQKYQNLEENKKQNLLEIINNYHKKPADERSAVLGLNPAEILYFFTNYHPFNRDFLKIEEINMNQNKKLKKYKTSFFYGVFYNHKRHGKGVMIYQNGRIYEGDWENDLKHGKGFEMFPNDSFYEGQYINGKPEGVGTYVYSNGEIYEGQWTNGMKHGSGVWKGNKGDSYIGEWRFGKAEGYGVHVWVNGDKYEGQFRQCLKHGEGTEKFYNGDTYVGSYVNGKPEGYGEYYWINGSTFKGYFKNGLRHGHGVWRRGGSDDCDCYEGEYINDKKCGYGKFRWASGNVYLGNYFDDLRHGFGEMRWTDGSYYKGLWERGIQNGEGEMCMPGEMPMKGMFEQNVFIGPINPMPKKSPTKSQNQMQTYSTPFHTKNGDHSKNLSVNSGDVLRDRQNQEYRLPEINQRNTQKVTKQNLNSQQQFKGRPVNTSYSSSKNQNNSTNINSQSNRTSIFLRKKSENHNQHDIPKINQATTVKHKTNYSVPLTRQIRKTEPVELKKTTLPVRNKNHQPSDENKTIPYNRGNQKNYLQYTHSRWRAVSENSYEYKFNMKNCLCCYTQVCQKKNGNGNQRMGQIRPQKNIRNRTHEI